MIELFLERGLSFGLYWGIWLLVPLLIDVTTAVVYMLNFILDNKKNRNIILPNLTFYPYVTIIIPVHNSSATLYKCLQSIYEQTYPREFMQVMCINNGSQDNSFEVFQHFHHKHPQMLLTWDSMESSGKSIALNAGLYSAHGLYIVNLDSDVRLDSNAIKEVVKVFENDSSLMAATGGIRVDKEAGKNSKFIDIINYCELIEYLNAFEIGRRFQDMKNSIFTLSGAFSIFRRDVIQQSFMYQERTVSEDTDITFNIRKTIKDSNGRIGFASKAVAYVEPIESLSHLYSQRVRWQRGELEVASIYYDLPHIRSAVSDFTGRILISDHTLAFLRLAWTFLLPFLYFLGYSLSTVVTAMIGMIVCYELLESVYFLVAYNSVSSSYRKELKKIWWIVFFLPFYRYLIFWFRISGIIMGLIENKSWKVENPVLQVRDILKDYLKKLKGCVFS